MILSYFVNPEVSLSLVIVQVILHILLLLFCLLIVGCTRKLIICGLIYYISDTLKFLIYSLSALNLLGPVLHVAFIVFDQQRAPTPHHSHGSYAAAREYTAYSSN